MTERTVGFNIECWRNIFATEEFNSLFSLNQEENFKILCQTLGIFPAEKLCLASEKNPYAPLWDKLLRSWGFADDDIISRFYELSEFAGMRPKEFRLNENNMPTVSGEYFDILSVYIPWTLREKKEKFIARGIYALATKAWTPDLYEELRAFFDRYCFHSESASDNENILKNIEADIRLLSTMSLNHLLGLNVHWNGWHWQVEHNRLMEEMYNKW